MGKISTKWILFQDTLNVEKQKNLLHVMKESNLGELDEIEVNGHMSSIQ